MRRSPEVARACSVTFRGCRPCSCLAGRKPIINYQQFASLGDEHHSSAGNLNENLWVCARTVVEIVVSARVDRFGLTSTRIYTDPLFANGSIMVQLSTTRSRRVLSLVRLPIPPLSLTHDYTSAQKSKARRTDPTLILTASLLAPAPGRGSCQRYPAAHATGVHERTAGG